MAVLESKLRRRALRLVKEYRALVILSKSANPTEKAALDNAVSRIQTLPRKRLFEVVQFHTEQIGSVADQVGLVAPLSELVKVLEDAEALAPRLQYVAKYHINKYWFRRFGERVPNWNHYPPHARIGLDVMVVEPDTNVRMEWRILEASLFEDMAMLWNEVFDRRADKERTGLGDARIPVKRFDVLTRSAVRAAFALLEGYLNGLALDILLTRTDLTVPETEILDELRAEDSRFRPQTLRNKILQYPKIALRREHPVVQESNSAPMVAVLDFERARRDSLMHPTPKYEPARERTREDDFYNVSLDDTRQAVDAVIALIQRIDHELDGLLGRISIWLVERGDDDRYPSHTFH